MGAGNYYFAAPAGDSWSKMVYVDLQPIYWTDEQERLKKEFDQFLQGDREDEIADATVVGEVGRMVIASAYTYYGTDLALIVTPRRELQDVIWSVENGGFEFERGWPSWQRDALRAENARLAGIKRSVESGALHREMQMVFERMARALHETGLAQAMWFRGCAWTGYRYTGTDLCKSIESRLARQSRSQSRRRQDQLVQPQVSSHQGA